MVLRTEMYSDRKEPFVRVRGREDLSFAELVWQNVVSRKVRVALTALAVAVAIMTVVALGVLTHSLRRTAISVLRTGSADFTVAQKGVSDVLYSAMDSSEIESIRTTPGVESVIGVLVASTKLDESHPFFLELGVQPEELSTFGVEVVAGRAYEPDASDEIMLGYRTARDFNKHVGDTFTIDDNSFRIVGIYSTGQVFGDSASMLPLSTLQANERKPGDVTLGFVRVTPGTNIDDVRSAIESDNPELATVRTESEFGRVDRNLDLISAANVGVSIMALVIGAIGVSNTMMMAIFERTREFGVLRAIGWSRARVLSLVLCESLTISLIGAMLGCTLGYVAVKIVQRLPQLVGVFQPEFTADVFGRALGIAVGMALIGAVYPAVRAALLRPLEALRHE
jgi:putative ABC transport system permease protein